MWRLRSGSGEVFWAFYRCKKSKQCDFWYCSFHVSITRRSHDIPRSTCDIPRSTRELSVNLLALSIYHWGSREILWHVLFVHDVSYKFFLARACMKCLKIFPNAWKYFRILVIDNSNSQITSNKTCHEILPITKPYWHNWRKIQNNNMKIVFLT